MLATIHSAALCALRHTVKCSENRALVARPVINPRPDVALDFRQLDRGGGSRAIPSNSAPSGRSEKRKKAFESSSKITQIFRLTFAEV